MWERREDLLDAVARGIDMFDCVLPTRNGRHGLAFTRRGPISLKNARHAEDPRPLDADSPCPAARDYSRAYLHHLVKAGEMLGAMLLTMVNLSYYQELMGAARAAIMARPTLRSSAARPKPPGRRATFRRGKAPARCRVSRASTAPSRRRKMR